MKGLSKGWMLGLAGITLLGVGGCSSTNPIYPEPKITDDVKAVMAMKDPVTQKTLAELFTQYQGCRPESKVWEEMEPEVIFFTCEAPKGGMIQFIWTGNAKKGFKLRESVITNMADQEWSATNFRGPEGEKKFDMIRQNRPMIEERSQAQILGPG